VRHFVTWVEVVLLAQRLFVVDRARDFFIDRR
jgi:hypothetical protein